jgi:hypothetical protein
VGTGCYTRVVQDQYGSRWDDKGRVWVLVKVTDREVALELARRGADAIHPPRPRLVLLDPLAEVGDRLHLRPVV